MLGSTTGVTAGSLTALSDDFLTVSPDGITAVLPSGKVTVVVPSWPTLTSVTVGFDFLTSSATLAFSASVKLLGSTTGVTAGLAGAFVSLVAVAGALGSDTLPAGSVAFAVTSPAGSSFVGVIVAFPFSSATPSPSL